MKRLRNRTCGASARTHLRAWYGQLLALLLSIPMCINVYAQTAPGTTDALWSSAWFGPTSAANTSITGDGDVLWFAMEHLVEPSSNQPGLNIFRVPSPWNTVAMKQLQAYGELTDDGMYPSIVTWPGAAQVWVTAKEDLLQPESHLRVYRQNRSNFTIPATYEAVTSTATGMDHGRPYLSRDGVTDEHYLCWTRKNATVEDVWSKAKDASTWLASADHVVSMTSDTEDHCLQAYFNDGARYLVYHRNQAAADDIWLKITTWDGTTWTNVATFALAGSAGADFPAIWTTPQNIVGLGSVVHVVAKSAAGDILHWRCAGTRASCDSSADFGSATTVLSGGDHHDPKIFVVRHGSGPVLSFTHDVFILYQKKNGTPQVKLASNCNDAGTWIEEGWLPMPVSNNYDTYRHQELGANKSSANPSVYWDGEYFHVAFLARHNAGIVQLVGGQSYYQLDLMHYYARPSDFCP